MDRLEPRQFVVLANEPLGPPGGLNLQPFEHCFFDLLLESRHLLAGFQADHVDFSRAQPHRRASYVHKFFHHHVALRLSQLVREDRTRERIERLALLLAQCRARHVHGYVAAANYRHPLADGELVAEVHVQQEIGAGDDAVEVATREDQVAAAMQADGQQNGLESLPRAGQMSEKSPSRLFKRNSGPNARISRTWACTTSRGRRYSGIPRWSMPPGTCAASKIVTA